MFMAKFCSLFYVYFLLLESAFRFFPQVFLGMQWPFYHYFSPWFNFTPNFDLDFLCDG